MCQTEHANLIDEKVIIDGVEITRGACSFNARDPEAPEFRKWKKIEQHSWLGHGTNVDKVNFQNLGAKTPKIIRKKLMRSDF